MRDSILWTLPASLLLFSTQTQADYTSDYNRLCPGNNPVTLGTTVYTVACDKTLGGAPPVQKIPHNPSPTPEECVQACEADRNDCSGLIWASGVCFQSSDASAPVFNAPGAVVLTPPPSSGKTPAQLEQELRDCEALNTRLEAERDEYKQQVEDDPYAPPHGTNSLDLTDRACNLQNDERIFTYAEKQYRIRYGYKGNGKQQVGHAYKPSEVSLQGCLRQCAIQKIPCKGVEFGTICTLMYESPGTPVDIIPRTTSDSPGCAAILS
ncbi:hypothetical protein BDV25DRAFT_139334 [Aspergillus avenaceus]|uniref:Apple domain-containing protein n=1 Tax=Aspergillus avenaceus TaxID=36643 RepID=A0A5N6TX86_ASPAV|nr:hypothetical protein BDV25DRAFT_139334 [Aspergillus avenaceus]